MAEDRLTIPGVVDQDSSLFLNTRSFKYFCDAVERARKGVCPFDGEMDQNMNPTVATDGGWRRWKCPVAFRAKDLTDHDVIAPVEHDHDLGKLTAEDFESMWELLDPLIYEFTGSPLWPHFGEGDVGVPGVHAILVVPDRRSRLEVEFNSTPNPRMSAVRSRLDQADWSCYQCSVPGKGIEAKHIIIPDRDIMSFEDMRATDYLNLSALISHMTSSHSVGLPGGALVMGLPKSAIVVRFGPVEYNACSIPRHLHVNRLANANDQPFRTTFAKDPDDLAEKMKVVLIWAKMLAYMEASTGADEAAAREALFEADKQTLAKAGK